MGLRESLKPSYFVPLSQNTFAQIFIIFWGILLSKPIISNP
jgi:hypothetical protein